jgi:hypothetical protein
MTSTPFRFGFRIVGRVSAKRWPVDAGAALAAYAACDPRAEVGRESYLSAFWFGADSRDHLTQTGSTKGFNGVCWSPHIWWDIDSEDDPQAALDGARRLAATILERYAALDDDSLLLFFSGAKGFHVGLPTFWQPAPSLDFHRVARQFAEGIAQLAGVTIDTSVYDKVRAFRAPNSRDPKTGLHKRRLSFDELTALSLDGIRQLAGRAEPFDLPAPTATSERAAADWQAAITAVSRQSEEKVRRRAAAAGGAETLNRLTLDFIRDGANEGDRHRLLFSAAANLAELGCPPALAHALLTEAALDCGLSPSDVRRQIDCGLRHGRQSEGGQQP